MQQHGSKTLSTDRPDPGVSSRAQNSTISEYGHVAYQIKGNHESSNMVATILPADPHFLTLEMGSKFNLFFRTWSCCISN